MLETAFKSSVDVAKAKIAAGGVKLDVVNKIVPLYDSFETQHFGKRDTLYNTHLKFFRNDYFNSNDKIIV